MIFLIYRTHNAGVEGSSPSLSINQISYFRLPLGQQACFVGGSGLTIADPTNTACHLVAIGVREPKFATDLSATQAAEFAVGAFGASLLPFH